MKFKTPIFPVCYSTPRSHLYKSVASKNSAVAFGCRSMSVLPAFGVINDENYSLYLHKNASIFKKWNILFKKNIMESFKKHIE